jgi:signal transduction histidine kinase
MESPPGHSTASRSSSPSPFHATRFHDPTILDEPVFVGRLNRKLSMVFGSFFFLALVGGGTSLYLAGSVFLQSRQTAKQSEQVYAIGQIHSSLHHFFSSMQRARLGGTRISDPLREAYLTDLKFLLASYEHAGGAEEHANRIREIIVDVELLSDRINQQVSTGMLSSGDFFGTEELRMIEATEQRIQIFAHKLSAQLDAAHKRDIEETQNKMKVVATFNAAFIVLAVLGMVAASLYFYRAIALPLRRLAQAALEITDWKLHDPLPVTSRDEIGALSHALNIMAKELRKHEDSLKGIATIEERERIAQELHDSLAQDLALIHLQLAEVESSIRSSADAPARDRVREIRKIAADSYEDVRQAIFGLRTVASKNLPFIPALKEYLREFGERIHIPVELDVRGGELTGLSPLAEIQLIRIIHEALSNVFKHAQATASTVTVERDDGLLKVTVEDNGKGFAPERIAGEKFHFGLQTMKERAEALGARLRVDSAPGQGTRVVVLFPLEERLYEANPSPGSR